MRDRQVVGFQEKQNGGLILTPVPGLSLSVTGAMFDDFFFIFSDVFIFVNREIRSWPRNFTTLYIVHGEETSVAGVGPSG